jgi:hypothetical protein
MMKTWITGGALAAAAAVALTVASPLPALAQLARPQGALDLNAITDQTTNVQWRRGWHGHRHWGDRHWGHRHGWGWFGPGLGFATGLALGSAFAAPYYYAPPTVYYEAPSRSADEIAYCSQRFRSYDPSSGTYLGYDGERHPCP